MANSETDLEDCMPKIHFHWLHLDGLLIDLTSISNMYNQLKRRR